MKRNVIAVLIILFCCMAFGFNLFGEEIRNIFSPRVTVCEVVYSEYGYVLPKETIHTDENGKNYILYAVKTEKYPEQGYEAKRIDCEITEILEDEVILSFDVGFFRRELVIVSADRPVEEGQRIILQ